MGESIVAVTRPTFDGVNAPEDLLNRVRGQYLEMPGLRLTLAQAARLLGLEQDVARGILTTLLAAGFLVRTSDGLYGRPQSQ